MERYRFDKLFTVEEANELIPRLTVLVRELQGAANVLRQRIRALGELEPEAELEERDLQELITRFPELRASSEEMARLASEIESFGCFLKDIDLGLLDFPCELDNDVVFLCWQFGESRIAAWHAIGRGFSERRALSGVPKPYLN